MLCDVAVLSLPVWNHMMAPSPTTLRMGWRHGASSTNRSGAVALSTAQRKSGPYAATAVPFFRASGANDAVRDSRWGVGVGVPILSHWRGESLSGAQGRWAEGDSQ